MPTPRAVPALLSLLALAIPAQAAPAPAAPASPSFLDVVRRYADTMLDRGRDTYGPTKTGLLLSALDRTTLAPLTGARPPSPAGVRRGDRSGPPWSALTGANPQLDQNLLRVLYALTRLTGDPRYAKAADDELTWFFTHAASPATGLLPWGEHLCWDVMEDKPISGGDEPVHEFARPWALWQRCFELVPRESERFARGLWEHQVANHQTGAFDRHAPYFRHGPTEGKDFPRHAGFYVVTWAHAYRHSKDPTFLRAIETMLSRFERKRVQKDGTMIATIGPLDCEAAAALVPDALAQRLRAFAEKEDELTLADLRRQLGPPGPWRPGQPPLWQTGYAASTQATSAMLCLARYEQTRSAARRDLLLLVADRYVDSAPEEDLDAWPLAFGHAISTQVAANRLTRKPLHLEQAQRLARLAVSLFWQDNPLPRASLRTGHYEAITGADSLALALLEVHVATHALPVELPSNTIDR